MSHIDDARERHTPDGGFTAWGIQLDLSYEKLRIGSIINALTEHVPKLLRKRESLEICRHLCPLMIG